MVSGKPKPGKVGNVNCKCHCGAEMWQEKVGEIKFFACPNCKVVFKLVEVELDNEILSKGKKVKLPKIEVDYTKDV